jgi:hypothetical protein
MTVAVVGPGAVCRGVHRVVRRGADNFRAGNGGVAFYE